MAAPDPSLFLKGISLLRSLSLAMFITLAACGYAVLFLPPFGGVDLGSFRRDWSVAAWLDAVTMTIFAMGKLIDLLISRMQSRRSSQRRRRRLREAQRLVDVYAPLNRELHGLYRDTVRMTGYPHLTDRLSNAWEAFSSELSFQRRLSRSWQAVWDKATTAEHGELSFGESFPIDRIENIVRCNLDSCDEHLVTLVARAERTRIENRYNPGYLSEEDCLLIRHVETEYKRLKRYLDS